ncbi:MULTISPECIES: hypothetical protein [Streptomyces]|uniref:hypothetical protein n=1 Tax=Streptomyces TaxID=1883 RepID=UPI000E00C888|nr:MULTISPECIES: hypothetical protein [Streptomyces]MBT3075150.1 hypothetical protein [Streptomyces sp. COG21]MBT3091259.1 hypothetical protein [Streptomyces sp. CYG21]MBT3099270.1 hypothetical protein [Streptomyces sp. CBG30]MBT3103979.1 hypothetical protein [Streptomyces sp. COG19]MBT3113383.1 hypothetical protein [Streptomyces sp. CYG20]
MPLDVVVALLVLAVTILCAAAIAGTAGLLHRLDGASWPTTLTKAATTFTTALVAGIALLTLLTAWMYR